MSGNKILINIFLSFFALQLFAVNGYKITLKSNVKNRPVYMYYQYGENRYPRDTAMTNGNGEAFFESNDTLTGGVFLFYLSSKKAFEFLLTDENSFSVSVDTSDIMNTVSFSGSKENEAYYAFLKRYKFNEFQMDILKQRLKKKTTRQDSILIIKRLIATYQSQLNSLKKQTIQNNPNTFVANLMQASVLVEAPKNITGKAKQTWLKKHYLDNVNFSDGRLAFSNVLYINYTNYINDCGFPNTDSVISCCDIILEKASAAKDNYKWSLFFLGNSFERSAITGQDKIFVHLVDEYYRKDRSWWLTQGQLSAIYKRADAMKKVFVGVICPDFTAIDSSAKQVDLHQQITKTTVLVFWSYDCSHCLKELPQLKAWMKTHPNINVITACVLPDEDKWKEALQKLKLSGTHLIDPELKANYIELYSILGTPQFFVLDKDKKIIAKYIADVSELNTFFTKKK